MADVPKRVPGASRDVKDISLFSSVPAFANVHLDFATLDQEDLAILVRVQRNRDAWREGADEQTKAGRLVRWLCQEGDTRT